MSRAQKRLQRELEELNTSYSWFEVRVRNDSRLIWEVGFDGAEGSVFAGERFVLQFKFDENYPIEAPEVIFIGNYPHHEHVYSNGYICLSVLYGEWSPSMRVSSIVLSIQSMLSSANHKSRPKNDSEFCSYAGGRSPKVFSWVFEDDKC